MPRRERGPILWPAAFFGQCVRILMSHRWMPSFMSRDNYQLPPLTLQQQWPNGFMLFDHMWSLTHFHSFSPVFNSFRLIHIFRPAKCNKRKTSGHPRIFVGITTDSAAYSSCRPWQPFIPAAGGCSRGAGARPPCSSAAESKEAYKFRVVSRILTRGCGALLTQHVAGQHLSALSK